MCLVKSLNTRRDEKHVVQHLNTRRSEKRAIINIKMTYITFDIFKKMCRYGKIEDGDEYNELYRRKIVPTNLVPVDPSIYYKKPSAKPSAKPNVMYSQMFEKKHGRKCNWRDKDDVIEYHGIRYSVLGSTPEYKARVKKLSLIHI